MRFSQIFFCSIRTAQLSSGIEVQERGKDHDPGLTTRYSSQVCQRWREVALGHSTLWGRIIHYTEDPLPWIDELLLRTHQTTLELGQARELGQLAYPKLSVLSRVMCHAQRLKTVNMLVEQTTWQGICEGILQNRAPSLDYFHLIVPSNRDMKAFTGILFFRRRSLFASTSSPLLSCQSHFTYSFESHRALSCKHYLWGANDRCLAQYLGKYDIPMLVQY